MNHQEKWQHLVHRIHKAQMVAIVAGYDPKEVWLGPEEMKLFVEYAANADKYEYVVKDQTITENKILGLRVMESKENGIRVGETFSPPTS